MHSTSVSTLAAAADIVADVDVVGLDEAQFFGVELSPFCTSLAAAGKRVVVGGLDGDYLQRPFGHVHALLPHAEHFVKLSAVCSICGADASFTVLTNGVAAGADRVRVGGAELYSPRCRDCLSASAGGGDSDARSDCQEQ